MEDQWEDVAFGPRVNSGSSFNTDALISSLINAESSGNPNAISPKGARGLMQVMPATGAEVAAQLGMDNYDLMNPDDNRRIGTAYFNQMLDQFQDPGLAAAAYNAGPGRVQRTIDRVGSKDPALVLALLPEETRNYVPKVLGGASQYGAQAQPTPSPSPTPVEDEWVDVPQDEWVDVPVEVPDSYLRQVGRQLAQGATFNFGDELGLVDKEATDQFEAEHPYQSMGYQIAGGAIAPLALALGGPTVATGGAMGGLATAGRLAIGMGAKNVAKTGLGRIGQGALAGAVPSAINAAGDTEGNLLQRAVNAGVGGVTGGIVGGGLSGGFEAGKYLLDKTPKEIRALASRLMGYGADDLQRASDDLVEAGAEGSPLFLPEAIDKPNFTQQAKAIANSDETANIAQEAIKGRRVGQYDRISKIADDISPVRSTDEATDLLVNKAKTIRQSLQEAREQAANPLYEKAYREVPTLDTQEVAEVLTLPRVQKAVKRVQLDTPDTPANSTKLLDEVLADLKESAGTLKTKGQPRAARRVMETSSKLESELEKIIPLKEARETFAEMSVPINKLKKAGFDKILKEEYGNVAAKEGFSASQLGKQLLDERTKIADVKRLKEAFGGDDKPIKAAVRSHIQDLFDKRIDGNDISSVLNTKKFKKKLAVLLGEKDASRLLKRMDREIVIAKGNRALSVGSDTATNIEAGVAEDMRKLGVVASTLKHPGRALSQLATYAKDSVTRRSPEVYRKEAEIVFSNDKAQNALAEILRGRQAEEALLSSPAFRALQTLPSTAGRGANSVLPLDGE